MDDEERLDRIKWMNEFYCRNNPETDMCFLLRLVEKLTYVVGDLQRVEE